MRARRDGDRSFRGGSVVFALLAISGTVLSGCESEEQPRSFCYRPMTANFVLEETKPEAFDQLCMPTSIASLEDDTPHDRSDDSTACTIVEATPPTEGCDCSKFPGRVPALADCVERGADLDAAIRSNLRKSGHCSDDSTTLPRCADWCVCLVLEYDDPSQRLACSNELDFEAIGGWCYVSPGDPPHGRGVGNEALVAHCPATRQATVRYVPAPGAVPYLSCIGV